MIYSPRRILADAADLLSVHGENAEYDRAIVELTTRLLGGGNDQQRVVADHLRRLNPIQPTH